MTRQIEENYQKSASHLESAFLEINYLNTSKQGIQTKKWDTSTRELNFLAIAPRLKQKLITINLLVPDP